MNFVSSVQCCERDGERKMALLVYFKMMEIKNKKLRSMNGRKGKTMNAAHSSAEFMSSPSMKFISNCASVLTLSYCYLHKYILLHVCFFSGTTFPKYTTSQDKCVMYCIFIDQI